jgi:hypothetical protein
LLAGFYRPAEGTKLGSMKTQHVLVTAAIAAVVVVVMAKTGVLSKLG